MAKFYNGRESVEVICSSDFNTRPRDVLISVSPAHAALAKLDAEEREVLRQYQARIIKFDKYQVTCDMIQRKRDKAIIALAKEDGSYISPAQIVKLEKQANKDAEIAYRLGEQLKQDRIKGYKELAWWSLIVGGLLLAICFPVLTLFYVGGILYFSSNK